MFELNTLETRESLFETGSRLTGIVPLPSVFSYQNFVMLLVTTHKHPVLGYLFAYGYITRLNLKDSVVSCVSK